MPTPLDVGVVGRAHYCPLFKPANDPHPIVICFQMNDGNFSVAWTSHTIYPGDLSLDINFRNLPSAFMGPRPLKTGRSPLLFRSAGRSMMAKVSIKDLECPDQFGENDCLVWQSETLYDATGKSICIDIHIDQRVKIPDAEWTLFRSQIFTKLGHI